MPPKRKNTIAEAVIEATPVKKTKGIMAEETTKYSEVETASQKQCSSQSEMAQQTCNCPCTCEKPRVLQQRYEEEGDKEDERL